MQKTDIVSVVRCKSYESNRVYSTIKKSLEFINFDFSKIKSALIKPNILMPASPEKCITTHPIVIDAICRILKENNIQILIGESGMYGTKTGLKKSGIQKIAEKYNAECFSFSSRKIIQIEGIEYPESIRKVDLIINVPKLKTHALTLYTGAVKNAFGFIPGGIKLQFHKKYQSIRDFSAFLVRNYLRVNPQLNIMDGILGMEGMGPSAGKPKRCGIVLSSRSGFALDLVACKIIGFKNVWTNKIAKKRKLVENIEIRGEKNIRVPFQKPSTFIDNFFQIFSRFSGIDMSKTTIYFDRRRCKECGLCKQKCPTGAITDDFNIINEKCIRCYCCLETCPNKAIRVKLNPLIVLNRKFKKLTQKMRNLFNVF